MAKGILDRVKNKRPAIYTDIDINMDPHPVTGDLVLNSDERAIQQSLRFLVLTNIGERVFEPLIGGDLNNTLFTMLTPHQLIIIKEKVKSLVTNYEKRAELIDVDVVAYDSAVHIQVFYAIRNNEDAQVASILIKRDR